RGRDENDGHRTRGERRVRVPIGLPSDAKLLRNAKIERRNHDRFRASIATQIVALPESEARVGRWWREDDDFFAHLVRRDSRIPDPSAVDGGDVRALESAPERLTAKCECRAEFRKEKEVGA